MDEITFSFVTLRLERLLLNHEMLKTGLRRNFFYNRLEEFDLSYTIFIGL